MRNLVSVLSVLAMAASAGAQPLVAYWHFPVTAPSNNWEISFPITADTQLNAGPARITTNATVWNGTTGTLTGIQQGDFQYFSGSTIGAVSGDLAGQALGIRGNTGLDANGKWVKFQLDNTGVTNGLRLGWAERGTTTGPTSILVEWSTDDTVYTSAGSFVPNNTSTYVSRLFDLTTTAVDNQPTVFIRMTFSGFSGATGGYRFDNVRVVPTPGASALLGVSGLMALRRRRR